MGLVDIFRKQVPGNNAYIQELAPKQSKARASCDNYQLVKGDNFIYSPISIYISLSSPLLSYPWQDKKVDFGLGKFSVPTLFILLPCAN